MKKTILLASLLSSTLALSTLAQANEPEVKVDQKVQTEKDKVVVDKKEVKPEVKASDMAVKDQADPKKSPSKKKKHEPKIASAKKEIKPEVKSEPKPELKSEVKPEEPKSTEKK